VGALDAEPQPDLAREVPWVPCLGTLDDIKDAVRAHCVDEIVVALPLRSRFDDLLAVWAWGSELGVRVSAEMDLVPGNHATAEVRGGAVWISWHRHASSRFPGRQLKRGMDLVLGGVVVLALLPLLLLVAVLVALDSRGPVLFRQERIGRGGRPFGMFKFRTMVENAEELRAGLQHRNDARGASFKIFDDPRVTRPGRWLRRSSVDELPQLLNVLRGEMSLVGPRPLPAWIAARLDDSASHRRLCVMPGMTGLWQVRGRRQDFALMTKLDLEYVDRWTPGLDLRVLAATVPAILRGENAY
jgi:lipopolysaccharide/colanic/teichoic acid biosynthesis glycosyltransferase